MDLDPTIDRELSITSPLTAAQAEIWIYTQMGEQANCAFNLSYSLRSIGKLNIPVLQTALQQLVDRHVALRMIFSGDGNAINIFQSIPLSVPVFDLASLDLEAKTTELATILDREVSQPFQVAEHLLFRAKIVKLDDEIHQIILTAHQLICDDRSWQPIITDLGQIYSALLAGIEPNLPPINIDFSQYAIATAAADLGASGGCAAALEERLDVVWIHVAEVEPHVASGRGDFELLSELLHGGGRVVFHGANGLLGSEDED